MSNEEDQSQFLDTALKSVKTHSTHMKSAIDKNDMRQCLKYASEMISELKTNLLSPKNYYQLYTSIFDEIQYLQSYIKDESNRGRRLKELYEAVQQCISIVPRIFLMITVGTVFIESKQCDAEELIYDIIQMIRGVQYPLRGLFSRYFLLKMFKDFFPNDSKEKLNESIELIMENFKEMNRLWIRIGSTNEKQRDELKVLVGENITRLSSLNDLSCDVYKEEIVPSLIKIINDSNDPMSQQYIIECIVHAFPDEYNIECMSEIFDAVVNMSKNVDVKSIFITIMEKISRYVELIQSKGNKKVEKEINEKISKIFNSINTAISSIVSEVSKNFDINNTNVDVMKITELQIAFMAFASKCAPIEQKLTCINSIMDTSYELLSKTKGERKMSASGIRLVVKLLEESLNSPVSIFQIKSFPELMNFLDNESKAQLSLKIIDNLVNDYNIGAIDTKDKMLAVIELVKPLLEREENVNENDQATLSKLSYVTCSKDPFEQIEILTNIKDIFISTKNDIKIKYGLIPIVNSLLLLGYQISSGYEYKESKDEKKKSNEFNSHYQLDKFTDSDSYLKFYQTIYALVTELILKLSSISSEIAFNLYISSACQVDKISLKGTSPQYEEYCYTFLSNALSLIVEGKIPLDKKYDCICILIGSFINLSILNEENKNNIITNLTQLSQNLIKRTDQAKAMMQCAKMYKDTKKIVECLTKAKKFAEYAMTSPVNSILFVMIINEYVMFDLKDENFGKEVTEDNLVDLVEYMKNYIGTIQGEGKVDEEFNKVVLYFKATMNMIKSNQEKKKGNMILKVKIE